MEKRILSVITAAIAISSGFSSSSNVGAKQENIKVSKNDSKDNNTKKEASKFTKFNFDLDIRNQLFHVLSLIKVDILENGLCEFKYERKWYTLGPDVYSEPLKGGKRLTIRSENDIDRLADEIINITLEAFVQFQSRDNIGGKINRMGLVGKYSDLINEWKEKREYETKIKELKNDTKIIQKLQEKMQKAKEELKSKKQKNVKSN